MKKYIIYSLLLIILSSPVMIWLFVKQVRVFFPDYVAGIHCVSSTLCLDDVNKREKAQKLYNEALAFVNGSVGHIKTQPRVIFCSRQSCFEGFGFSKAAAQTIGMYGVVIGPRGWKNYILRHEIIHHLQAERLGIQWQVTRPSWLVEGMAYALSGDPRLGLTGRFQRDRQRFRKWYLFVGKKHLWQRLNTSSHKRYGL